MPFLNPKLMQAAYFLNYLITVIDKTHFILKVDYLMFLLFPFVTTLSNQHLGREASPNAKARVLCE